MWVLWFINVFFDFEAPCGYRGVAPMVHIWIVQPTVVIYARTLQSLIESLWVIYKIFNSIINRQIFIPNWAIYHDLIGETKLFYVNANIPQQICSNIKKA